MPGPKPRTRHAETAPQDPPDEVGGGFGRQGRDVPHRCSRKGAGGQSRQVSTRKGKRSDSYFRAGGSSRRAKDRRDIMSGLGSHKHVRL